jgi:hypothetical protein
LEETRKWLDDVIEKQVAKPLNEDPVFKLSDIDVKIKRVEAVLTRVSSIPKPKDERKKSDKIKIENITIDGDSDINWEDIIKINKKGKAEGESD